MKNEKSVNENLGNSQAHYITQSPPAAGFLIE